MGSIRFRDKIIHYDRKGSGDKIVIFLHGYAENKHMWRYVNDDVPFESIAMDFPGFGESEFMEGISIPMLSDCVRALVIELNIKKPILIGHSLGGYVALAYANEYPQDTAGIGLINSHPFADTPERVKTRNKSIQFLLNHGTEKYLPLLFENLFYSNETFIKKTKQHFLDMSYQVPVEVWIEYLKAMRDKEEQIEIMKSLNIPVLIILGKHDKLVDYDKQISQAEYPSISELILMENAGHMSQFEERIKTREAIIDFVTGGLLN